MTDTQQTADERAREAIATDVESRGVQVRIDPGEYTVTVGETGGIQDLLMALFAAANLTIIDTDQLARLRRTEDAYLTLTDRDSYGAELLQCQKERRLLLAFRDALVAWEDAPTDFYATQERFVLASRLDAARAAVAGIGAEPQE